MSDMLSNKFGPGLLRSVIACFVDELNEIRGKVGLVPLKQETMMDFIKIHLDNSQPLVIETIEEQAEVLIMKMTGMSGKQFDEALADGRSKDAFLDLFSKYKALAKKIFTIENALKAKNIPLK